MRPKYELADILTEYGQDFIAQKQPLKYHQKVLNAINKCRTAALGGHVDRCGECSHERISYNSCRNRHCPKCQTANRDRWIAARQSDLLDCKYFHVVFTLPEVLNHFCLHYPAELYEILFQSSKETLLAFGRDEKYLGAEMGAISILHTWGQNLMLHPHIHMIVPAGGVDQDGNWQHTRSEGKYLFPVKAMSAVYRGKFIERFKAFLQERGMELTAELRQELYAKEWIVYAKRPFGGAQQVIEYLGRYTHKIAISNHRLQSIDRGQISFTYKDYRDDSRTKTMTLEAAEFLRRFCLHILPQSFREIRHYGILSSRNKPKLKEQQAKMGVVNQNQESPYAKIRENRFDPLACPCCKTGKMETVFVFRANTVLHKWSNAPPFHKESEPTTF
ncbi:IS91 family transposase [Dyadobacter frigoris]|uniref:IS91 family transposase n=1 Tax=Dyadobacter frigoris TaxID=2576211 RepID=UPI002555EE88|nr:IS91 family transposase [Dyadobacter frigoris]